MGELVDYRIIYKNMQDMVDKGIFKHLPKADKRNWIIQRLAGWYLNEMGW